MMQRAQLARLDQPASLEALRAEVGGVVNHEGQALLAQRPVGRGCERARLGHVDRHWLLHQHVLARRKELRAHLCVA